MRRSRCNRRLLALVVFGLVQAGGRAQPATAQTAPSPQVDFLLIPVGARAAAMGQAAVTDAATSEAVFWNPAGLALLPRSELAVHHYSSFFGPGDAVVLAVPSAGIGAFALAAYIVDYGNFDVTPASPGGPPPGPIAIATVRNIALSASFATTVGGAVSAGIGYKLVQFRVDCSGDCSDVPPSVGTTHSVDVGALWRPGGRRVSIGVALRHIGFKLQVNNQAQADPLPTTLQAGASWVAFPPPATGDGFDIRVAADVQARARRGVSDPVLLIGLDAGVRELVRLRGGYAFLNSEARGPSLGIGLSYASFAFDLARVFFANDPIGEEEPVHLSLRLFF
jgi:hypothetical protein